MRGDDIASPLVESDERQRPGPRRRPFVLRVGSPRPGRVPASARSEANGAADVDAEERENEVTEFRDGVGSGDTGLEETETLEPIQSVLVESMPYS